MTRMKNRLLALLCVIVLMLSLMPAAGAADPFSYTVFERTSLRNAQDVMVGTKTYTEDSRLIVRLQHDDVGHPSTIFKVGLYDENDTLILSFDSKGNDTDVSSVPAYVAAGTYTVKVSCPYSPFYSNVSYVLSIQDTPARYFDSIEAEHNNSRETANVIALNTPVTGNFLHNQDEDFFKVTLPQAGTVTLGIAHKNQDKAGDFWQFSLFDADDRLVTQVLSDGKNTKHESIPLYLDAGDYTLRASCPWPVLYHSTDDYNVTVNYAINTGSTESEPNNTAATADSLFAQQPSVTGNLHLKDDVDYYSFTAATSGTLSLKITHPNTENQGATWAVTVYDQTDKLLLTQNISGTETVVNTAAFNVTAGQRYTIKILCPWTVLYYSQFDYTLTVQPGTANLTALVATPTASTVFVDGKAVSFDAYVINGNNYLKLRDLAFILSGSAGQFEVSWDGSRNAISLTSDKAYTPVGGEMTGKGAGNQNPIPSTSIIVIDGEVMALTAFTIGGNNYFKLREIGFAMDFAVDWDSANNAVVIDTAKGYTAG